MHATDAELFWKKVNKRGPKYTRTKCWLWTGCTNTFGYGIVQRRVNGKKVQRLAHRVALEITGVEIPDGMKVCHRCDLPRCVRPTHLYVGTQADNMADMKRRGKGWWQKPGPQRPRTQKLGPRWCTEAQGKALHARWMAGESGRSLSRELGRSASSLMRVINRVMAGMWNVSSKSVTPSGRVKTVRRLRPPPKPPVKPRRGPRVPPPRSMSDYYAERHARHTERRSVKCWKAVK